MSGSIASVSRTVRILALVPLLSLVSGRGFNNIPTHEEQAKASGRMC